MATYIQGITDYIPKLQPFQPDFNFFQKALETKQGQYDAGYNKISAAYGQLLNSELLREPNEERRNEFFTGIDNEIKRLSGVDLSLPENVNKATKLFQPLIDNSFFRADLAYTKQFRNAKRKSQNLRDFPNPKDTETKWWAEGDRGLDFQAEDFAKSTDDQSLRFSAPRYVPFINAAEKLYKFGKDNDINPESFAQEGGYNITYANGEKAIPKLQDVFGTVVMGDPRIKDMFLTQSYVDRKNAMKTGAEKYQGDELAAEKEYLKLKVDQINTYYRDKNTATTKASDAAKTTKKVLEKKIQTQGVDPDIDKDLIDLYRNSVKDEEVMTTVESTNKEVLSQTDAINFDEQDIEGLRYRVDNAMSYFLMDNLVNETARSYANSKMKILKFEADPFAINTQAHNFRLIENAQKFGFDEKLKMMDIALEVYKKNGGGLEGMAPASDGRYSRYESLDNFLGRGQVTTGDLAVMDLNTSTMESVSGSGEKATIQNVETYLALQNSRLTAAGVSEDEKTMIRQQISDDLGIYNEVVEPGFSYTQDAPTDWGGALMGMMGVVGGMGLMGISGAATAFSGGALTPLGVAGVGLGATAATTGSLAMSQALGGDQKITVPSTVKAKSGLVKVNADGKYELIPMDQSIGITDPNSGDYWQKVNDRIGSRVGTIKITDKNSANVGPAIKSINENSAKIQTVNTVLSEMQAITIENNKKLIPALANESGVDSYNTEQFYTADKTRRKTSNEYVEDFVRAYKDDERYYPRSRSGGYQGADSYPISEQERLAKMRQDASDNYDDLSEAYETLSKNPDASVGISTFNPELMQKAGGVSAQMGTAYKVPFDPVFYNELGYKDAMDLFNKDISPAVKSEDFRNQVGSKFLYGNGYNLTKKDYDDTDHDANAAASLFFAMQAASLNYGGKTDGEGAAKRASGEWTYYSVAANTGNKMAATFTFNPEFVKAHAGSMTDKGPLYELNSKMAEGEVPEVTFFIDADKAKSTPFISMQGTMEEFLFERGKLEVNVPDGGNIKFSKNALGGVSYSGSMPSVDSAGVVTMNPVFGTTNENVNSVYNTFLATANNVAEANLLQRNALSSSSTNKITDINALPNQ